MHPHASLFSFFMRSRHRGFGGFHGGRHHRHDLGASPEFDSPRGGRGGRGGPHRGDDGAHFGRRIGRLFERGDLRLLILWLIEQQPRHGYELIRLIEDMSGGAYAPSPGAIYPTLTLLEEEGHVVVDEATGNRKRYALTDAGKQLVEANRNAIEAVIGNIRMTSRMVAKMAVPAPVMEAMHRLKSALLMHAPDWSDAESGRVVAIVEDAAARIADAGKKP